MRIRVWAAASAVVVLASCETDQRASTGSSGGSPELLLQSPQARERIAELRERFRIGARGESSTKAVQRDPVVGQAGKDVSWLPTADPLVGGMLQLANVTSEDTVMDLGSGDGRLVIAAAQRGARAVGIEYEPELVELSKRAAQREGVSDRARFVQADLFDTDLSKATVITLFLMPELNLRLRPKLLELAPGTRVVSNTFTMGAWTADDSVTIDDCDEHCSALLWIVPAKVSGSWKWGGGDLHLEQRFQLITGTLSDNGVDTPVSGRLHGEQITLALGEARFSGRVTGDAIEGLLRRGIGEPEERVLMTGSHDDVAIAPSPQAELAELTALAPPVTARQAVIGPGVAHAFAPVAGDVERVRVDVPPHAKRASVELPLEATGFVRLEDDASHMSVRFALQGASAAPIAVADGMALYAGAVGAGDLLHRVHGEGTEDFVVFERRPAHEELRYTVDVSHVAGLRLVSNTLELLDDGGAPRLRVAPPYVVDAHGERHSATLAIDGCDYDSNPSAPWGRAVTRSGAPLCTVRIAWQGVAYPAVVDPAWTTTGSMAEARSGHTANVLGSGNVLIAGGPPAISFEPGSATAELYNPETGTFAATGQMSEGHFLHTASTLFSGQVLVAGTRAGGNGGAYLTDTAELYDEETGSFSPTGSMTQPRGGHTASVLQSGRVLVIGGTGPKGGYGTSAELYDPDSGTFSPTGSMVEPRGGHTASLLESGKVLVAGGNASATAELYDPTDGNFSLTGPMLQPHWGHTASVLLSGSVLIAGGPASATAELYDPTSGAFSATIPLVEARASHTASLLWSGEVLLAGGSGSATAELFDPATSMFSAALPMLEATSWHTASVLPSCDVLVVGGTLTDLNEAIASAELYDVGDTGGVRCVREPGQGGGTSVGGGSQGGASAGGASQGGASAGGASQGGASAGGGSQGGGDAASDEELGGGCRCDVSRSPSRGPVMAFAIALVVAARTRRRGMAAQPR